MINILSILGCIIPLKVGYHHDFMAGFVLNIFLKQEEFEKKNLPITLLLFYSIKSDFVSILKLSRA